MTATVFAPMVSGILRDRKFSIAICGLAAVQLFLVFAGLPGWPCPFLHASGLPCPGCGLTRATLLLAHGELRQAVVMHAFAPVFLIALMAITVSALSPKAVALRLAHKAELLERYTGITAVLLIALILYWLARLVVMQDAFVQMIQG